MSTTFKRITGKFEDYSNRPTNFESGKFPTPEYKDNELSLTSFAGGKERGRCLQVTLHDSIGYAQFTKDQATELRDALNSWLNGEELTDV